MADLLSVQDARSRILAVFQTVEAERVLLEKCGRRILAEDIISPVDLPPFANSSMDGFALLAADTTGAQPGRAIRLQITAHIPAGKVISTALSRGQAAWIMTGAVIPPGADAVIPVEDTSFFADGAPNLSSSDAVNVEVFKPVKPGDYIRPKGQDIQKGQALLTQGRKLQPQDVGMLAAIGKPNVLVYRQPTIALFSSGDELVQPGQPAAEGQIYDSNQYVLAAMLEEAGANLLRLGAVKDDAEKIAALLDRAAGEKADLIVTSAGVSVGAFDFVRQVMETKGTLNFWKVNMRPGKPLVFGSYSGVPVIALPGNPVSAYVGCKIFVLPVLAKLTGRNMETPGTQKAFLAEAVESDGRESYLRAVVWQENGQNRAKLASHQGSGNLFSLVQANALLIVPSGVKSLPLDSEVNFWPLANE